MPASRVQVRVRVANGASAKLPAPSVPSKRALTRSSAATLPSNVGKTLRATAALAHNSPVRTPTASPPTGIVSSGRPSPSMVSVHSSTTSPSTVVWLDAVIWPPVKPQPPCAAAAA